MQSPNPDPENADLLAALGDDLPEHLRFRNGLAPWERPWPSEVAGPRTLKEAMREELRRRELPRFVVA